MPRCPGCGTELPANSRFCSICGAQVSNPAASPTLNPAARPAAYSGVADDATAGRSKIGWAIGGAVLIVALAGFLFAKASGLLSANKTAVPSAAVLNAPPTNPVSAPLLNAPQVAAPKMPAAPVLQAPTAAGNPMPADVIDYLRWLKQFEAARRTLEDRGKAQVMILTQEMMKESLTGATALGTLDGDPNDPTPKKGFDFSTIDKVIQEWNQAAGLFQQKTPPNPCATLATNYNSALTEIVRQTSQLMSGLRSTLESVQKAGGKAGPDVQNMLSSLQGQRRSKSGSLSIDQQFNQANVDLDALRDRYTNIPPDIDRAHFDIKEESGGGGLSIPGF